MKVKKDMTIEKATPEQIQIVYQIAQAGGQCMKVQGILPFNLNCSKISCPIYKARSACPRAEVYDRAIKYLAEHMNNELLLELLI